ncbi:beta-galactosidase [Microbacterium sp.]|uniref:beta-galactosidase n=1 Tax=Microbacterium sp. TaxID=51671 RepID=UPI0039E2CB20
MASNPRFSGILFGAAYYAEYQPEGTLERDLDLMAEAGFTVVRVGESVWSTWEPREGEFDLDWLQPVLDGAHARGIGVVLGTPTYAIPPWLQTRHPEIAGESSSGARIGWGARQEMDQSQPAYRFYAERIVRKVVSRYCDHPAVIGYQVDNEPGNVIAHNRSTFHAFLAWLRSRYGTVERLNEEWGLVYWSHRLSEWSELWRPDGNLMPQYQLEWRRFQATLATDLVGWQAEVVREYARDDQFITTCISYTRPQISDDELVTNLDLTAGNPYYLMQTGLDALDAIATPDRWWHSGVPALVQWGDRAWSSAQAPFLVTETNAQSIGGPWTNHPPFPGQLRQAAFALLARGARMIEYWHWHTLHFGVETYWGGILPHNQVPGRIYREISALGTALRTIGGALDDFVPHADVLMLWSTDTKWSWDFFPPLANMDGSPNTNAYTDIFDAWYDGLFEAGAQMRVQHVRQFLEEPLGDLVARFPVLVAPAVYIAEDAVLEKLVAYAEAGGHLVLGIRTGYGDDLGRARREVAPARIAPAAGIHYEEYTNLSSPLPVLPRQGLAVDPDSAGVGWADLLEVDDATVLADFAMTEFGARPALTTKNHGNGRVTYLATVPNRELGRSVGRWLVPHAERGRWDAPAEVTVSSGCSGGVELTFVFNWSGASGEVTAPAPLRDLVSGETHRQGDTIVLDAREARLFEVATGRTLPIPTPREKS